MNAAEKPCSHPATRQYSWVVREIANDPSSKELLCVGCCDCGVSREFALPGKRAARSR